MFIVTLKKKRLLKIGIIIICFILLVLLFVSPAFSAFKEQKEVTEEIKQLINVRNNTILTQDVETMQGLYDRSNKYGKWAYEHCLGKMNYLHNWGSKQGIVFTQIISVTDVKRIEGDESNIKTSFSVISEYRYYYKNEPDIINVFKIGTYHTMTLRKEDNNYVIVKEWYTDPFADSMSLNKITSEEISKYILNQESRDLSKIAERRKSATEYADQYCGIDEDGEGIYNKKYENFNYLGGDCANFASQMLYEGGKFKKTYSWNYNSTGGTKAWLNAQGFKDYMIYSGRASKIAYGTYEQVYKASYKLQPGDFVAYVKKGKVVHISVVTGADSKGYSLVNSHNTDRYRVPWDLGWSDKGIKFWLVHVHY